MGQDGVRIMIGSPITVTVTDAALRKAIYDKLAAVGMKAPNVSYDAKDEQFVLVFSDGGEIGIAVGKQATKVADSVAKGNRYEVYAKPPEVVTGRVGSSDSGGPVIPPPDTMCPCGGP